MGLKYLSIPKAIDKLEYEHTVNRMLNLLSEEEAIVAIYRMGNVNHPGISDLDLIVVFEDGKKCELNPSESFTETDKYIFTHSLAGASVSHFRKMYPYTFWDNLNCIYGDPIEGLEKLPAEDTKIIKQQTALEYLYKNLIELTIQKSYGVIKLRSILQETKAIRYDLEFLNIKQGRLHSMVQEFLIKLDHWFQSEFEPKEFQNWINQYLDCLQKELTYLHESGLSLWLPEQAFYRYGRNVSIKSGDSIQFKRKGISLPPSLIVQSKRIYNANLRFNQFCFEFPFSSSPNSKLFEHRFKQFQEYKAYNAVHFPHFEAMFSSLANQVI